MKFIIYTEFGELLDLALYLKNVEKQDVSMHISDADYRHIGDGLVDKLEDWYSRLGEGSIWVFDSCSFGKLQDWLRSKGEFVFGGTEQGDKLENDRQLGQKLFKLAGFKQVKSQNFTDIDDALKFVEANKYTRWILKQNGSAPKSINYKGKFSESEDMLYHLIELKKKWNESQFGEFNADLMEVVEGLEIAASGFFNGQEFLKDKDGKVVGFLNFEEKKEANGATGETVGEMGTTFVGVTEDNTLFKDILLRPKVIEALQTMKFKGVFDINCIKTKDGIVALEPTCRFGIPATSYEFIEGLTSSTHQLIEAVAKGELTEVEIVKGTGMVMCVVAKPYPIESDVVDEATSTGEKLWFLDNGKSIDLPTEEQQQHIHLENFFKQDDDIRVATKNGYLFTVTGVGKTIGETRDNLIKYIKDNVYISGMKYRTDIGARVEEVAGVTKETDMEKRFEEKFIAEQSKHEQEVTKLKKAMKDAIYGS